MFCDVHIERHDTERNTVPCVLFVDLEPYRLVTGTAGYVAIVTISSGSPPVFLECTSITDTSLVYLSLASLLSILSLSFVSLCLSLVLRGYPKFVGISLCRFTVLDSTFYLLHTNM